MASVCRHFLGHLVELFQFGDGCCFAVGHSSVAECQSSYLALVYWSSSIFLVGLVWRCAALASHKETQLHGCRKMVHFFKFCGQN